MGSSVVKAGSGFYHRIALIFKVRAVCAAIRTLHVNHPNGFGTSKTSKTTKILGFRSAAAESPPAQPKPP
jgi:hypothetical protein